MRTWTINNDDDDKVEICMCARSFHSRVRSRLISSPPPHGGSSRLDLAHTTRSGCTSNTSQRSSNIQGQVRHSQPFLTLPSLRDLQQRHLHCDNLTFIHISQHPPWSPTTSTSSLSSTLSWTVLARMVSPRRNWHQKEIKASVLSPA